MDRLWMLRSQKTFDPRVPSRASWAILSLLTCLTTEQAVHAQTPPASQISQGANEQCAYVRKIDSPKLAALRDSMFVPGKKLDVAALMKDPQFAQIMQDMAKQDHVRNAQDWAALCTYKTQNIEQKAKAAPRVIFLGDSITEFWRDADPGYF